MKYRKKPVVVEAQQWFPDKAPVPGVCEGCIAGIAQTGGAHVHTLEGIMKVSPGEWIITGTKGERYPCKKDIFESSYERVDPE